MAGFEPDHEPACGGVTLRGRAQHSWVSHAMHTAAGTAERAGSARLPAAAAVRPAGRYDGVGHVGSQVAQSVGAVVVLHRPKVFVSHGCVGGQSRTNR